MRYSEIGLSNYAEPTYYVPDLLIYEIANVLRYKPDLDRAQVQQALESLYDMQIKIEDITAGVIRRAIEIAYACFSQAL